MYVLPLINLAQTANGIWTPGIGDPTFIGWFTVVCYFVVAYLCYRNARAMIKRSGIDSLSTFWWTLTVMLVFLGCNKQLDLQSLLTDIGRELLQKGDWYANRRIIQKEFIIVLAAGGLVTLSAGTWILRRHLRDLRLILVGMILLITFIIIRASSFHHVEKFFGFRIADLPMIWILELSSLASIGFGAFKQKRVERENGSK